MTIDTYISRAAVLEILRTPAASDTFPDMIRRVEALEGCCVRVKALEWQAYPFSQSTIDECAIADAPFSHRYQIQRDPWAPTYLAMLYPRSPVSDSTLWWESKGHADMEAAKAAAQADYEARVLAALEPVAQPETPTPGQFTTMCLAIEDVITGRGFDVDPWHPIETAPNDGERHIRGLWVTSNRTGAQWWEAIAGHVDDDGEFVDHDGNAPWRCEDYGYWMPLPKPPGETTSAIPEAVKAYLRNALMVGGWRGERE